MQKRDAYRTRAKKRASLFKTQAVFGRAHFRAMLIQNFQSFLGTLFKNSSYDLAVFNGCLMFMAQICL